MSRAAGPAVDRRGADSPTSRHPTDATASASTRTPARRLLDRALYLLAAYTGLRQGELRGLEWSHIDFATSTVHVLAGLTRGMTKPTMSASDNTVSTRMNIS